MDERDILALLLRHNEDGLDAALRQYGKRLHAIAAGIVGVENAEECVNDALFSAWNAIPPEQPLHLRAYLCKLTRNTALNRYAQESAKKRGGAAVDASIEELAECLPAARNRQRHSRKRRSPRRLPAFFGSKSRAAAGFS